MLTAIANDEADKSFVNNMIAPEFWSRMPPEGLTREQRQAFR